MPERRIGRPPADPHAQVELLRTAFPVDVGGVGRCGWCGEYRKRKLALCSNCWNGLDQVDRNVYRELDIFGRARWIVENKSQAALAL